MQLGHSALPYPECHFFQLQPLFDRFCIWAALVFFVMFQGGPTMMLIERLEERGNQLKKMTFWKVRSLEDLEGHLMLVEIHHQHQ